MKISPYLAIPAPFLLLALAGCAGQYQASPQTVAARKAALDRTDRLIVPGQRIGPVRLGMGMDEVEAILGKDDFGAPARAGGLGEEWDYVSLNLFIMFSDTSAPQVVGINTTTYSKQSTTFGEEKFADCYPIDTAFQLAGGIGLGSSSFEVQRTYGSNFNEDGGVGIMMSYPGRGVSFRVSQVDHKVLTIYVQRPR